MCVDGHPHQESVGLLVGQVPSAGYPTFPGTIRSLGEEREKTGGREREDGSVDTHQGKRQKRNNRSVSC